MELGDLEGIKVVKAEQADQSVYVEYEDPATEDKIVSLLTEINYPPAN
jgi:regulator of RNase E activity RraA